MTRTVRLRRAAAPTILAFSLALTLAACSDGDSEPLPARSTAPVPSATSGSPTSPPTSPTQSATTAPAQTATTAPTTSTTAPTTAPTSAPTTAGTAAPPVAGGDAAALAAFLPEGFPIPGELTITGDPTHTDTQSLVTFTVPDPAQAFEFFRSELPGAGYTLLPGTSEAYSPEVASGAILAQSEEFKLNLLIVDDEVEILLDHR